MENYKWAWISIKINDLISKFLFWKKKKWFDSAVVIFIHVARVLLVFRISSIYINLKCVFDKTLIE